MGDTVSSYGPVTFSSKPTQINTCSESKCSSTAQVCLRKHRTQQKEETASHSISLLLGDGAMPCERQQPAHLLRELQAGKHNHFLWKNLSFQPLFIHDAAQSRTGNVWCLCIVNNKTRTGCSLLLDVTSVAGNLVNDSERMGILLVLCIAFPFLL